MMMMEQPEKEGRKRERACQSPPLMREGSAKQNTTCSVLSACLKRRRRGWGEEMICLLFFFQPTGKSVKLVQEEGEEEPHSE